MNKISENNVVKFIGEVSSKATYSHECFGERFYKVLAKARRLSGFEDEIPLIFSSRILGSEKLSVGCRICVYGQFRSFNWYDGNKSRLALSIFALEIEVLDDTQIDREANEIRLDGYICKTPIYRVTPLGREIADVFVAVNRAYEKSDYIPCICWGRDAKFAAELPVGSHVSIYGRIQSREYVKKIGDEISVTRTAYEVSSKIINVVESEE